MGQNAVELGDHGPKTLTSDHSGVAPDVTDFCRNAVLQSSMLKNFPACSVFSWCRMHYPDQVVVGPCLGDKSNDEGQGPLDHIELLRPHITP